MYDNGAQIQMRRPRETSLCRIVSLIKCDEGTWNGRSVACILCWLGEFFHVYATAQASSLLHVRRWRVQDIFGFELVWALFVGWLERRFRSTGMARIG